LLVSQDAGYIQTGLTRHVVGVGVEGQPPFPLTLLVAICLIEVVGIAVAYEKFQQLDVSIDAGGVQWQPALYSWLLDEFWKAVQHQAGDAQVSAVDGGVQG